MSQANICDKCERPAGDAFACRECARSARGHLSHIADLTAAIDEKRARVRTNWAVSNIKISKPAVKWRTDDSQQRTFGAHAGFAPSTALSFDPRVSRVANRVHAQLVASVKALGEDHPWDSDPGSATLARYLSQHVEQIRFSQEAGDEFGAFERIKDSLFDLFDNPPDTLYLGRCSTDTEFGPCTEALYVENVLPIRDEVTCPHCAAEHKVPERREELLTGVEDYLATAKEVSRLLRTLAGRDVTKQAISRYVAMGKLSPLGKRVEYGRDGRQIHSDTYRIGAVRELVGSLEDDRRMGRATRRIAKRRRLDNGGLSA